MHKNILIILISFFITNEAFADVTEGFIFRPALTLEYQIPKISTNKSNGNFKNRSTWNQIKNFDNIVPGLNFRLHKYWGINTNWSQFTTESSRIAGYDLEGKASLKTTNYNISSLFYAPLIGDNLLEGFVEIGASRMKNKLKFNDVDGSAVLNKSSQTALFYGAGIEFAPYNLDTSFRLGVQKYNSSYLSKLHSNMYVYRVGVVQHF